MASTRSNSALSYMAHLSISSFFLFSLCLFTSVAASTHAHIARTPTDSSVSSAPASPSASPSCKASPNSPAWPSLEAWARLNASTNGRLLRATPPGAVCHTGPGGAAPSPNNNASAAAECQLVQSEWADQQFHADDPVSVQQQQWNNDSCIPFGGYSCSGEGYPAFVVNASSAGDVKAAVDFARRHGVRLIVKSSGHDFVGRSSGAGALSVWLRHFGGTETHKSFVPQGCGCKDGKGVEYGSAITAGGGAEMQELYAASDAVGQVVVGGGGRSVSVGGYLTGGGHSLLSPRFGMAADQVLEVEIVTSQGEILTLNECQHEDLFWAVRGGGGSTFGVITRVTLKMHPSPKIVHYNLNLGTPNTTDPALFDMIAYMVSQYPYLSSYGVSGYGFWATYYPLSANLTVAGFMGDFVVQDTTNTSLIEAIFQPLIDHINTEWPNHFFQLPSNTTAYPSFAAWFADHYDTSAVGNDSYVGSRLLPASALTGPDVNLTTNAAYLRQFTSATTFATAYLVAGGTVANTSAIPGGGNAVNPAWRASLVHATTAITVPWQNLTARAEGILALNGSVAALREMAPDSGAYVNEADPYEPDFQHAFWGDNYERLLEIKRKVDPEDVFWCHPCVGNERWEEIDGILCRKDGNVCGSQ